MRQSKSFTRSIEYTQHGLTRIVTTGSGIVSNVEYKSSKPFHIAPEISHEEGEDYVLKNGNTFPKDKYDSLWNPKKQAIKPKNPVK